MLSLVYISICRLPHWLLKYLVQYYMNILKYNMFPCVNLLLSNAVQFLRAKEKKVNGEK